MLKQMYGSVPSVLHQSMNSSAEQKMSDGRQMHGYGLCTGAELVAFFIKPSKLRATWTILLGSDAICRETYKGRNSSREAETYPASDSY
jgi:hypothetical protein